MPFDKILNSHVQQNTAGLAASRLRHPTLVWFLLSFSVGLSLLSANPVLSCAAICILPIIVRLTWRFGEPPVLLFAVFFQWLQVSMTILYANLLGKSIPDDSNVVTTETAIWLSLTGLVVLALGMRIGVGTRGGHILADSSLGEIRYSQKKIWRVYLIFLVLGAVAPPFLWQVPQMRTIALGILPLKWVAYFVLAYLSFARNEGFRNRYLIIATLLEIFLGFSGYFSSFKQVFFMLGITFLTAKVRLKNRDIVPIVSLVLIVFFLAVCWSSIKTDYRQFLNQNTGQQVVVVPFMQRIQAVVHMASGLDGERFLDGLDQLARRIAYVEMFARVVETVPRYLPHEEGELWWAAVRHIAFPRLLFPDKPELPSDSDLTIKYTLVHFAGAAQGTSISMGYMAESYIDFGAVGMFVPIFLCGLLWGFMYRYLTIKISSRLIAYGMVTALLINVNQFEMHSVKLLGGMIMNFLVFAAVSKYILPRYLGRLADRS